jgi:hypothetical protein
VPGISRYLFYTPNLELRCTLALNGREFGINAHLAEKPTPNHQYHQLKRPNVNKGGVVSVIFSRIRPPRPEPNWGIKTVKPAITILMCATPRQARLTSGAPAFVCVENPREGAVYCRAIFCFSLLGLSSNVPLPVPNTARGVNTVQYRAVPVRYADASTGKAPFAPFFRRLCLPPPPLPLGYTSTSHPAFQMGSARRPFLPFFPSTPPPPFPGCFSKLQTQDGGVGVGV